jgi:formamidopyrimidine-DNA glycosylase
MNQGCARCTKIIEGEKVKYVRFVYCKPCLTIVKARDKEIK